MEILLNFAWALLALTGIYLWARTEHREGTKWHLPFIALVMLIVMLFPVISVSDDLWAMQNPAETDSVSMHRRGHSGLSPHSIFPASDALVESCLIELNVGAPQFASLAMPQVSASTDPALAGIQNRPPPAA